MDFFATGDVEAGGKSDSGVSCVDGSSDGHALHVVDVNEVVVGGYLDRKILISLCKSYYLFARAGLCTNEYWFIRCYGNRIV